MERSCSSVSLAGGWSAGRAGDREAMSDCKKPGNMPESSGINNRSLLM